MGGVLDGKTTMVLALAAGLLGCDAGPRANGTLGAWSQQVALPIARANHCSAVVDGYLLVIGGNDKPAGAMDFVTTDLVHAAKIGPDGVLGPWTEAGHTPSPVTGCSATGAPGRLYLSGGLFTDQTQRGQVWTATVSAGVLGTFSSMGMLPEGHLAVAGETFVRGGQLYVTDAELSNAGDRTVTMHAPLAAAGDALGAWTTDAGVPGFHGQSGYAIARDHLFTAGGYLATASGNPATADVWSAPLAADGTVGTPVAVTPLPAPRTNGELVAADEYLFYVGGKTETFAGTGLPDVFGAHIAPDGTLSAWTTLAPMPEGRTNLDAVIGNSWLFATGGGSTGGGLDNVYEAQARF